jgi:hypothetical protein
VSGRRSWRDALRAALGEALPWEVWTALAIVAFVFGLVRGMTL